MSNKAQDVVDTLVTTLHQNKVEVKEESTVEKVEYTSTAVEVYSTFSTVDSSFTSTLFWCNVVTSVSTTSCALLDTGNILP